MTEQLGLLGGVANHGVSRWVEPKRLLHDPRGDGQLVLVEELLAVGGDLVDLGPDPVLHLRVPAEEVERERQCGTRGVVTGRVPTTPEALRAFAAGLRRGDEVTLEATMNTSAIAGRCGRAVVSNPLKTRAIAEAKIKTDKVDARVLTELLAADLTSAAVLRSPW